MTLLAMQLQRSLLLVKSDRLRLSAKALYPDIEAILLHCGGEPAPGRLWSTDDDITLIRDLRHIQSVLFLRAANLLHESNRIAKQIEERVIVRFRQRELRNEASQPKGKVLQWR